MSQFHERKLILPFLSALAGEPIFWGDNACREGRLRKYLFYEMIVTPSLVRLVREDPDLRTLRAIATFRYPVKLNEWVSNRFTLLSLS